MVESSKLVSNNHFCDFSDFFFCLFKFHYKIPVCWEGDEHVEDPGRLCVEEEQRIWQSVSMQRKERYHLARQQAKVWLFQGKNPLALCESASSHGSMLASIVIYCSHRVS